jgi:hypothetical protein
MILKCIKKKCSEYVQSEYMGYCNITKKYLLVDEECPIEEIVKSEACKISQLFKIKETIEDNQNNT